MSTPSKKPKKLDAAERIANKYAYTTYPELPKARAAIRRAIRAAEKRAYAEGFAHGQAKYTLDC